MKDDCRKSLERVYFFLDGEVLSDHERLEIQTHLEECPPCLERYGLEREITTLVTRVQDTSTCPEQLKTRLRNLLDEF